MGWSKAEYIASLRDHISRVRCVLDSLPSAHATVSGEAMQELDELSIELRSIETDLANMIDEYMCNQFRKRKSRQHVTETMPQTGPSGVWNTNRKKP